MSGKQKYEIATEAALREAFWSEHPHCETLRKRGVSQNGQCGEVRMVWCDFVDSAQKEGRISEALADRAVLKG